MGESRLRGHLRGAVQGVGFRPFVFRLATELGLGGWVSNDADGVRVEVEGAPQNVAAFRRRVVEEHPALARVVGAEFWELAPAGLGAFRIVASDGQGPKRVLVLPDVATCLDCLRELFDPGDRRFRYPFLNCTHCGPRYTIVRALPYDRSNTSMAGFPLCPACRAEYEEPRDRRFHAQPIACPACGPTLRWSRTRSDEALQRALAALRDGQIVAVKALGGFHLMVDARDEDAVARLRARKRREHKPLAVLAGSLEAARKLADLDPDEAAALTSPQAPIVLVRAHRGAVAPSVAPENPNLGLMLPSNPLQHLLMADLGFPVVATSGNLSEEPMCFEDEEALARLDDIADGFLGHDRPIVRPVDDSIVRVMAGREVVLRRARGYAPCPVGQVDFEAPAFAYGAHLKAAVALAVGGQVVLGQHIGDLESEPALAAYDRSVADLRVLYEATPLRVACDLHPDYLSTARAEANGAPLIRVQHHLAHALACLAENAVVEPALAVVWDGAGLGTDGTIWGGEFLWIERDTWRRVARLRPFPLPGGDAASRHGSRSAVGLLWGLVGCWPPEADGWFSPGASQLLRTQLEGDVNCPRTSSMGRLFDAAAALLGVCARSRFEGEAAMRLEHVATDSTDADSARFVLGTADPLDLDPTPLVAAWRLGGDAGRLARGFHCALAQAVVDVARHFHAKHVALTGGCFQNMLLLESCVASLRAAGLVPVWHQRVPPNDGGVAFGQLVALARGLRENASVPE